MEKNQSAVSLGRLGGLARAKALTPERLREIALDANRKRWSKTKSEIRKQGLNSDFRIYP